MTATNYKQQVAEAALDYCLEHLQADDILGIGTGSTANCFIQLLGPHRHRFKATVASSEASAKLLQEQNIAVVDINDVNDIAIYVDGADEINADLHLIKGGGGALTREKIVAANARTFVCIADHSKLVNTLGAFPLPIEFIPMSRNLIIKATEKLGGQAKLRDGFITDNGNHIIDVSGLSISDAISMEQKLNQITGLVTNGLFAMRPADIAMLSGPDGIQVIQ